jgi:hypothetical protein
MYGQNAEIIHDLDGSWPKAPTGSPTTATAAAGLALTCNCNSRLALRFITLPRQMRKADQSPKLNHHLLVELT